MQPVALRRQPEQADIDAALQQALDLMEWCQLMKLPIDIGIFRGEDIERAWYGANEGGTRYADVELSDGAGGGHPGRGNRLFQLLEDEGDLFLERRAGDRQFHIVMTACEQLHAKPLFELFDLLAQRWL